MDKLKIALDYDDTYTAAPEIFNLFVHHAKQLGHEVAFVTWRYPYEKDEIEFVAEELGIPIIYCSRERKRDHYNADIWIDDNPEAIVF